MITACLFNGAINIFREEYPIGPKDDQFKIIFQRFDVDGDGKISYKDFHESIGQEIHPGETLYFRQDKPHMMRINKCLHFKCWQPTMGRGNFCTLHNKMYVDKGVKIFQAFYGQVGSQVRWKQLLNMVQEACKEDDEIKAIEASRLEGILKRFGVTMSEEEREVLINTFPGRNFENNAENKPIIVVEKLFEVRFSQKINNLYRLMT